MPSEGTEGTSMTVHRSWLFVPGDDERKLARAGTSGADALIFDLEDAVVPARRDAARGLVADVLASPAEGGERWVRINPLDSPDALDDLAAVVRPGLAGVVLPKLRSAADVTQLGHHLDALAAREGPPRGSVGIPVVATETPEMVFRLGDLAGSSKRLRAVT